MRNRSKTNNTKNKCGKTPAHLYARIFPHQVAPEERGII